MKKDRALWVALGVLVVAFVAFQVHEKGPGILPFPSCPFRKITGLNCPGCGMTRATYATLHGEIGQAFRNNALGMILLPVLFAGMGIHLIGWVRGRRLPFSPTIGRRTGWGILVVVLMFWILRNIPQWPFTLLAPP